MAIASDTPTKPPALQTRDAEANFSYADPSATHNANYKGPLRTWGDVKHEWKTGSRKRVVRHYVVSLLIGVLVGGIIGMAIGLAIRYTVGKH